MRADKGEVHTNDIQYRFAFIAAVLIVSSLPAVAAAGPKSCDTRTNNTVDKLLECVTLDGVRAHQAALQAAADANDGNTGDHEAAAAALVAAKEFFEPIGAAYFQRRIEAVEA